MKIFFKVISLCPSICLKNLLNCYFCDSYFGEYFKCQAAIGYRNIRPESGLKTLFCYETVMKDTYDL